MILINENYSKLSGSYLFSEVAKRVNDYKAANPQANIIRLGIGDVTQPLQPAIIQALHEAVDEMSDSKTLKNLMEAFAGESQANRKYTAYAQKADKEGKTNAAKLFRAAADAETLHALKHFEVAGKIGSTADNLKDGVAGETHEYKDMYPDFVKEAEAEGNKAALMSFTFAMKAEEVHAKLYKEALENLDKTEEVFYYLCPVCGNIEKVRPDKCSICGVPGDKFIKY